MPLSERAPKVLAGAAELSVGTGIWSGVGSLWIPNALTYFLAGLHLGCESARGLDADRHIKPLFLMVGVGSNFQDDSQAGATPRY